METVKNVLVLGLYGMRDLLYGVVLLKNFFSTTKDIKKDLSQSNRKTNEEGVKETDSMYEVLKECVVFGLLFWIPIYLLKKFIIDYCHHQLCSLFSLSPEEIHSISWLPDLLTFVFNVLWIAPMYCVNRCLNFVWYQKIADISCEKAGIKNTNTFRIAYSLSDQLISAAVQVLFWLQGYIYFILPVPDAFKIVLSILHLSLLNALYAFEYKWFYKGWTLEKRLLYLDSKWPYFVGFGLPLAVLTSFVGTYVDSMCLFSTLFPFCVISTTISQDTKFKEFNFPLKVFRLVTFISDFVIVNACKCFFGRGPKIDGCHDVPMAVILQDLVITAMYGSK